MLLGQVGISSLGHANKSVGWNDAAELPGMFLSPFAAITMSGAFRTLSGSTLRSPKASCLTVPGSVMWAKVTGRLMAGHELWEAKPIWRIVLSTHGNFGRGLFKDNPVPFHCCGLRTDHTTAGSCNAKIITRLMNLLRLSDTISIRGCSCNCSTGLFPS